MYCDTQNANMSDLNDNVQKLQDPKFERRWYLFESICWVVMALLIAGACLGLLGPGPLSEQVIQDPAHQLTVTYPGIARARLPADIRVQINASKQAAAQVSLILEGALVESIQQSRPVAAAQEANNGRIRLTYQVKAGSPAEIVLEERLKAPGPAWSRLTIEGGPSVELHQFTLP
jgi:hypothetical protein